MDKGTIAQKKYDRLINTLHLSHKNRNVKLSENPHWKEIKKLPQDIQEAISLLAFKGLVDPKDTKYYHEVVRKRIFKQAFNSKQSPSQAALISFFQLLQTARYIYILPIEETVFCFNFYKETFGKDKEYIKARNYLVKKWNAESHPDSKFRQLIQGINKLEQEDVHSKIFETTDVLGQYFLEHWEGYDEEFIEIIKLCWSQKQKSQASKTWLKAANHLIQNQKKRESHIESIESIFSFLIQKGKQTVQWLNSVPTGTVDSPNEAWMEASKLFSDNRQQYYLLEENEVGMSYLIWCASLLNNEKINALIGDLSLSSFKKIKWIGSLCTKNGNACLFAFTLMPEKIGIIHLLAIRNKTQNKNIRKLANNHIQRKAKELKLTEEALLELSVPTFNIRENQSRMDFGDFEAIIDVSDIKKPVVQWLNKTTQHTQKAIPKIIKENQAEKLKIFKARLKEINTAFAVHTKRLENSYINNIVWDIQDWIDKYLKHPFLSRFASRLIWYFDDSESGIIKNDVLINQSGKSMNIDDFNQVKLWHPIYSDVQVVQDWREFLLEQQILQPFKQAFREIYKITDAEIETNTYSNRFAAHILYQYQFSALAKVRNWNYKLQGGFDSFNTPNKVIPKFDIKAEYWINLVQDSINESNLFEYLASDQVRVYQNGELLPMDAVPEIVFSEIMRDIDLFVGVCSIGNNPEWEDRGEAGNYWNSYSFGDLTQTAEMRRVALEMILPKLKILKNCKIEGKFLQVKGKIRDYKIHIGSGNILMSPNDQYLCIVPKSSTKANKIFLPFDEDSTLSIILSKAFLLSSDDKIKDETITRQINF